MMSEQKRPDRSRHVVITGATGGIGEQLCRQFAANGYDVSAMARDAGKLDSLFGQDSAIAPYVLDVADDAACNEAMADAARTSGPVDVLIANAAIYPKGFFLDQPASEFAQALRINVEGVANCIRPVLPSMLERNLGRIIVMGSLSDIGSPPGSYAYSVSKGALHPLVRTIAREIDRTRYPNVLVNEFSPGPTKTRMSDTGHDPADIYSMLIGLVECGPGGPHGQFFQEGRLVRIGESWKAALKRLVLRR